MISAATTTNHKVIRNWVGSRDGRPAKAGERLLRIDFREPEEELEEIEWEEFFEIFENEKLAFLHQDMTEQGGISRFNKFVERTP